MGRGRDRIRSRSPPPRNSYSSSRHDSSNRFGGRGSPLRRSRFDGPGSSRFTPPPSRFDGPPPVGRFDAPPPGRFDGPGGYDLPPPAFAGPEPPHPMPEPPGNDIEIIVVNKEQWGYAEMIESRLQTETPIKYIDLLFLHSPQHISMTLNDLFERQTLYAIIVNPTNEEHGTCTLHILHNQTEHRNVPLDEAIPLIARDFHSFMARGPPPPGPKDIQNPYAATLPAASQPPSAFPGRPQPPSVPPSIPPASNSTSGVSEKRLPDDIAYILRTILSEGSVQFLSLQQIDSVVDFLKRERDRLTSSNSSVGASVSGSSSVPGYQSTNNSSSASTASALLENPQVKAALNSLLQIGAIYSAPSDTSTQNSASIYSSYSSTSSTGNTFAQNAPSGSTAYPTPPSYLSTSSTSIQSTSAGGSQGSSAANSQPRRHPLMGTEISPSTASSGYSSTYNSRTNTPINRGYSSSSRH